MFDYRTYKKQYQKEQQIEKRKPITTERKCLNYSCFFFTTFSFITAHDNNNITV